jgi:hypothetical protein
MGVTAAMEGGVAACCLLPRLAHGRATHAGPSTNRGTPARGLAQVVVTYGLLTRVRNLPSLGLETRGLGQAQKSGWFAVGTAAALPAIANSRVFSACRGPTTASLRFYVALRPRHRESRSAQALMPPFLRMN